MSSEPDEKLRVATIKKPNAENYTFNSAGTKDRRMIYKLTFVRSMNRPIIFTNRPKRSQRSKTIKTTGYQKYEHEANTGTLSRKNIIQIDMYHNKGT
jgi:hypothetical protein